MRCQAADDHYQVIRDGVAGRAPRDAIGRFNSVIFSLHSVNFAAAVIADVS
jgi:hypothetical protein